MKFFSIMTALLSAMVLTADTLWLSNPAEAAEKAKAENKPIFALFTAPEWCPPCRNLEKNVLSAEDFAAKASKTAVLLQFDISDMEKVPADLKEPYKKWLTMHQISTVPTMLLTDAEGKMFARFNFSMQMTPASLLKQIEDAAADMKSPWSKDPAQVMKKAEAEKKPVFLLFTAPGWCGPCRQLEANALAGNFAEEAQKDVILLEIDLSDPASLPAKYQLLYAEWAKKYSVKGYPTMLVLDSKGSLLKDIPNKRGLTTEKLLSEIREAVR